MQITPTSLNSSTQKNKILVRTLTGSFLTPSKTDSVSFSSLGDKNFPTKTFTADTNLKKKIIEGNVKQEKGYLYLDSAEITGKLTKKDGDLWLKNRSVIQKDVEISKGEITLTDSSKIKDTVIQAAHKSISDKSPLLKINLFSNSGLKNVVANNLDFDAKRNSQVENITAKKGRIEINENSSVLGSIVQPERKKNIPGIKQKYPKLDARIYHSDFNDIKGQNLYVDCLSATGNNIRTDKGKVRLLNATTGTIVLNTADLTTEHSNVGAIAINCEESEYKKKPKILVTSSFVRGDIVLKYPASVTIKDTNVLGCIQKHSACVPGSAKLWESLPSEPPVVLLSGRTEVEKNVVVPHAKLIIDGPKVKINQKIMAKSLELRNMKEFALPIGSQILEEVTFTDQDGNPVKGELILNIGSKYGSVDKDYVSVRTNRCSFSPLNPKIIEDGRWEEAVPKDYRKTWPANVNINN